MGGDTGSERGYIWADFPHPSPPPSVECPYPTRYSMQVQRAQDCPRCPSAHPEGAPVPARQGTGLRGVPLCLHLNCICKPADRIRHCPVHSIPPYSRSGLVLEAALKADGSPRSPKCLCQPDLPHEPRLLVHSMIKKLSNLPPPASPRLPARLLPRPHARPPAESPLRASRTVTSRRRTSFSPARGSSSSQTLGWPSTRTRSGR